MIRAICDPPQFKERWGIFQLCWSKGSPERKRGLDWILKERQPRAILSLCVQGRRQKVLQMRGPGNKGRGAWNVTSGAIKKLGLRTLVREKLWHKESQGQHWSRQERVPDSKFTKSNSQQSQTQNFNEQKNKNIWLKLCNSPLSSLNVKSCSFVQKTRTEKSACQIPSTAMVSWRSLRHSSAQYEITFLVRVRGGGAFKCSITALRLKTTSMRLFQVISVI